MVAKVGHLQAVAKHANLGRYGSGSVPSSICSQRVVLRNSGKASGARPFSVCMSGEADASASLCASWGPTAAACSLRKDWATCSRSVAEAVRNTCISLRTIIQSATASERPARSSVIATGTEQNLKHCQIKIEGEVLLVVPLT